MFIVSRFVVTWTDLNHNLAPKQQGEHDLDRNHFMLQPSVFKIEIRSNLLQSTLLKMDSSDLSTKYVPHMNNPLLQVLNLN